MKQKTTKKIIELADGFENWMSLDLSCVKLHTADEKISIALKYISKWEHYPLLLRRAVEGWNKKNDPYDIAIDCKTLLHYGKSNLVIVKHFDDYQKTDYLTPQEQAIEACLVELLEDIDKR